VEAGEARNNVLAEVAGIVFREAVAGLYPAREAYEALIEAVQPYEPGRAEGILARVIGYVQAESPDAIRAEWSEVKLSVLAPPRTAWDPEPLDDVLSGDYEPEKTVILVRADGVALLYAGKTHSFSGESESGKSWLALLAALADECSSWTMSPIG
jgi:hypothetical protein